MKENGKKGRLAKENYLGRLEIRLIEGVVECNLKLIESKEREERVLMSEEDILQRFKWRSRKEKLDNCSGVNTSIRKENFKVQ